MAVRIPEKLVFLLGLQRSGTTWLANILDASPETLMFMEPFAPDFQILAGFPEAAYFLEHTSPFLQALLREQLPQRFLRTKYLLTPKSLTQPRWFRLERQLLAAGQRMRRLMPGRVEARMHQFELLNLNRLDAAFPLLPKQPAPAAWVIKELRLAGKIPVLLDAFPHASYIVIVRHPAATVHSILSWFQKGRLGELARDMGTFLEKIEVQKVAEPYGALIEQARQGDLACRLALYWRINYEVMTDRLRDHPQCQIVPYEKLAAAPVTTAQEVVARTGLAWSPALDEYLAASTSQSEPTVGSALNTVRDSQSYYQAWTRSIHKSTHNSVLSMVEDSQLMELFQPYYEAEVQPLPAAT